MASDMPYRAICAWNAATCSIGSERPSYTSSIKRRKCCEIGLWDAWDNCLKHSHYSLDLVGEPLESLGSHHRGPGISRGGASPGLLNKCQYRPGCGKAGSRLRTKGAGVARPLPRLVASQEGHLLRGCQALSALVTSGPPCTKILLGFPPRVQGVNTTGFDLRVQEGPNAMWGPGEGARGCSAQAVVLVRIFL
ncbi:hypothetical protein BHE74_00032805 [Ensete ventricosum]|nr:hypothetical protein BHE74_00032805 [Ensete ventricosum]